MLYYQIVSITVGSYCADVRWRDVERKQSRAFYLDPIFEYSYLNISFGVVIPVYNSIRDCFFDRSFRYLILGSEKNQKELSYRKVKDRVCIHEHR